MFKIIAFFIIVSLFRLNVKCEGWYITHKRNCHIHIPYIIFTSVFNVVCVTHFSVVFLKITFGEPQLI